MSVDNVATSVNEHPFDEKEREASYLRSPIGWRPVRNRGKEKRGPRAGKRRSPHPPKPWAERRRVIPSRSTYRMGANSPYQLERQRPNRSDRAHKGLQETLGRNW